MRVGVVILPEFDWSTAQLLWRRAEQLGFDHAWTYDHLAWRSFRDSAWFGALPTLTAAAMVTQRIRLGTLVASPNFRHPVPLAKELITLDDISCGRLTLGIGAGASTGWDVTMLGQAAWSPTERADRFAEFVALTDRLLRDPAASLRGQFYTADEARTFPGCVQRPRIPFAVAANGRRGMELAATYGQAWVTVGEGRPGEQPMNATKGAKAVGDQMARFEQACARLEIDPAPIDRLVLTGLLLDSGLSSVEAFRDTVGRYSEVGVTDLVVHWPRPAPPFAGNADLFERIIAG